MTRTSNDDLFSESSCQFEEQLRLIRQYHRHPDQQVQREGDGSHSGKSRSTAVGAAVGAAGLLIPGRRNRRRVQNDHRPVAVRKQSLQCFKNPGYIEGQSNHVDDDAVLKPPRPATEIGAEFFSKNKNSSTSCSSSSSACSASSSSSYGSSIILGKETIKIPIRSDEDDYEDAVAHTHNIVHISTPARTVTSTRTSQTITTADSTTTETTTTDELGCFSVDEHAHVDDAETASGTSLEGQLPREPTSSSQITYIIPTCEAMRGRNLVCNQSIGSSGHSGVIMMDKIQRSSHDGGPTSTVSSSSVGDADNEGGRPLLIGKYAFPLQGSSHHCDTYLSKTVVASLGSHNDDPPIGPHHQCTCDYEAEARNKGIQYTISEIPSCSLTILLGIQNALAIFAGLGLIPLTIVPLMGGTPHQAAQVIGSIAVVTGINTLIQTTMGNRLPLFQVPSFAYLPPTLSIIQNSQLQAIADPQERCIQTMQVLSGAVLVTGMVQTVLGYSGAIIPILKLISPITVASVITTIGLAYYDVGFANVSTCFPMGITMMLLAVICSQYAKYMGFGNGVIGRGGGVIGGFLFLVSLFPLLVAMGSTWSMSIIFTENDMWEEGSACRTDGAREVIEGMPVFLLPYPGQWHGFRFESYAVVPMLGAMLASMIESVGDYYSCANICGAPPPTPGIISRGLAAEGIGVMTAGLFGTGSGTTSSTGNIGVMALTGVGSRAVVQMAAIFLILAGIMGKTSATLAALPTGIIGGMFCVVLSVLVAVGLSSLRQTALDNHRNLFIVGFSIFYSLSVAGPGGYFTQRIAEEDFKSPFGESAFGQIVLALMTSPMIISLFTSMIMDNSVPGTDEERGMHVFDQRHVDIHNDPQYIRAYSLPRFAAKLFQNCGYLEMFHRGVMPDPPADGSFRGGTGDLGELWSGLQQHDDQASAIEHENYEYGYEKVNKTKDCHPRVNRV